MGRRSEKLMSQEGLSADMQDGEVIQVVSRAFDILRCFEGPSMRLANGEIAGRCGLPRSTVSRLTSPKLRWRLFYPRRGQSGTLLCGRGKRDW